jgi:hypothetical protein
MGVKVADTALARVLTEYAWSRRPPLSVGQMAVKAGVSRGSMYAWIGQGVVPEPESLYQVSVRLGIPLSVLYEAAGIPQPEAPRPRRTYGMAARELALSDLAELWDLMIVEVRAAMAEAGHGEAAIQQVVAHIRARQFPERLSLEGNVVAEFAEGTGGAGGGPVARSTAVEAGREEDGEGPKAGDVVKARGKRRG